MKKSFLSNLLLVVFSTLLTFILCEFVYRSLLFGDNERFDFLRDPAYYAIYHQDDNEDLFNETYWKLNYLFGRGFDMTDPHPFLGWSGLFNRESYEHWHVDTTGSRRPVLLYGNSFSMCVDSVKCYEDYLNKDSIFSANHHMHNFGVGGYGVDQITMLFDETIDKYEEPFVLFGLLTTDLDRSMLKMRDAPKPYFKLENDELILKGTPLTKSTAEYVEENPVNIPSYILNRMYNIVSRRLDTKTEERAMYIDSLLALNRALLKRSFDRIKKMNLDFTVIIFQPGEHNPRDWRLAFLRQLCIEEEVPFVCNVDIITQDKIKTSRLSKEYFIPIDGHPNSMANSVIAEEMRKLVMDSSYVQSLKKNLQKEKVNPKLQDISLMKMYISRDDSWLTDIKRKALENSISVDSQLFLDAAYMTEIEPLPN